MTRGKFVVGKTETGMEKAKNTPTSASVTMRKIIDLEYRTYQ
jgi:hypothetical protein